ncbi:MAG: MotA/TolQ/ExbB proton channel family protein [Candidatus Sericytochromatia bacterium]|nr:MotA/TolQ/ExbB proton channel family protein [Candidatus Sericytochromatia bacterium]
MRSLEPLRELWHDEAGSGRDFIATNLGIVLGLGLLGWAILSGSQATKFFYNPEGLAIVVGGTIAATLISFPASEVLRVFDSFRIVFTGAGTDFGDEIISETCVLAHIQREGDSIVDEREHIRSPFLRDGVSLFLAGYRPDQIRETLETSVANRSIREMAQVKLLRTMGNFAPSFGMVGTLIGLVQMFSNMKDLANIGPGLAVAFINTFYGTLLANLIFYPMAEKLETRRVQSLQELNMTVEGILMLAHKEPALYIEGVMNSFLAPGQRHTRFDRNGNLTIKGSLGGSKAKKITKRSVR